MFATLSRDAPPSPACAHVEALARARFDLCHGETVVVSEVSSGLPGCPPLETVIAFWTDLPDGGTQRHHTKVFKPAHEVLADDLPPGWMKPALAVAPNFSCDCC